MAAILLGCISVPTGADAKKTKWKSVGNWGDFQRANRSKCSAPFAKLRKPRRIKIGKNKYQLEGTRLVQKSRDKDSVARIGVLSAPKDGTQITVENIKHFVRKFKLAQVNWVVVNGDIGHDKRSMVRILKPLGRLNVPVLVMVGNGESVHDFNDALSDLMERPRNIFNMNFTRTVEGDDVTLVGVPGYFNRDFVYAEDGCVYDAKSLRRIKMLTHGKKKKRRKRKKITKPVVLISHGPPMGRGESGIDRIYENQNVGDPALENVMKRLGIRFGIFGHILESAGRATTIEHTIVEPGQEAESLLVNAGSVSGIPWTLLNGIKSHGMAIIMTLHNGKASYEILNSELQTFAKKHKGS